MELVYGNRRIPYTLTFSPRRKTVKVSVSAADGVEVVAPAGTAPEIVARTVESRAKWVVQQLLELKDVQAHPAKEYVNGESFPYLGRAYRLAIHPEPARRYAIVGIEGDELSVRLKDADPSLVRKAVLAWYRRQAKQVIEQRIAYFAPKLRVQPSRLTIKDQKLRWGSCTKTNGIIINYRAVMAPIHVLDYIVVHELCHVMEKSHTARFWRLVADLLPDYEARKKWLLENGTKLDI